MGFFAASAAELPSARVDGFLINWNVYTRIPVAG
jgi:hypothetical protein